jgi:TATA-binding protein-associated factor Taf7
MRGALFAAKIRDLRTETGLELLDGAADEDDVLLDVSPEVDETFADLDLEADAVELVDGTESDDTEDAAMSAAVVAEAVEVEIEEVDDDDEEEEVEEVVEIEEEEVETDALAVFVLIAGFAATFVSFFFGEAAANTEGATFTVLR